MKITKYRKKRKGVGPILIAFVAAAVLIGGTGLFSTVLIEKFQTTVEMVRESTIINAINFVESIKMALDDAVVYSIHKAAEDVLISGGFCEHSLQSSDSGYCSEECKISDETPTYQCKPWWKINDEVYAPTRESFTEYMKNRTLQNFGGYAGILEAQGLEIPDYYPPLERDCSECLQDLNCPEECEDDRKIGGVIALSSTSSSDPTISTIVESKNDYLENSKIAYTGEFFSIVDNSTFSATVKSTAFSLFGFARNQFIEGDYVSQKFEEASDIANQWCEVRSEIYYGNACPNNLPTCSADMVKSCKEDYDIGSGYKEEDSNRDGSITSDEYYNYTVKNRLLGTSQGTGEYGNVFTTSISLADCIKVGVEGTHVYSEWVEVDWQSYDPVTHQDECSIINEEGCGCWETCTASDLECGECASVTAGISEGPCPWDTLTCPDECCGVEYDCREWTEESCEGTVDSSECTDPATNCDQECCIYSTTQTLSATESTIPYYVLADGSASCNNVGLGTPSILSTPIAGQEFQMLCSVDQAYIGADCIYANADGLSYQCTYIQDNGWFYNNARFICPGLPAGTYNARCTAITGTSSNCCYDVKTASYTVVPAYCERKSCSNIAPVNGVCPCGCTETSKVMHEITLSCRSSACGFDCCKKAAYLEDVKCIFDYAGTAALKVEVSDTVHTYPIESESKNLNLPFYVVSGNAVGQDLLCEASTTDDDPSTEEIEFPEWQECKEPHI